MRNKTLYGAMVAVILSVVLAACASAPAAAPGNPTTQAPAPATPGVKNAPVNLPYLDQYRAAVAKAAGVPENQISLGEVTAVDWPDSCLGLGGPAESCALMITPGYRVVFQTPKGQVEVHANKSGETYRVSEVKQSQDAVLTWQRSGGFAGQCQRLFVNADGSYRLQNCVTGGMSEGQLPADAAAKIQSWAGQYSHFEWNVVPQSGSADMYTDALMFNGQGSQMPTAAQQEEVANYLASLTSDLQKAAK